MKSLGFALYVGGGLLGVAFLIWAATGFYASQLPVLAGLGAAAASLVYLGSRLHRDPDPNKAVSWSRVAATGSSSTSPARATGPGSAPIATAAVLSGPPSSARASDPLTPLDELGELADQSPEVRHLIAANPAAYPDLLDWLALRGDPAINAALAARGHHGTANRLPSESSELRATAVDPQTPQVVLAELAYRHPKLRHEIAANPSAYAGLRKWITAAGSTPATPLAAEEDRARNS